MPLAAFGGKRAVMEKLGPRWARCTRPAPCRAIRWRQPAALATLREVARPGFYEALAERTRTLVAGLIDAAESAGVPMVGDCEGGMFGFFFAAELPQKYGRGHRHRRDPLQTASSTPCSTGGVYLAPALYEAGFVSAAHSAEDIAATLDAASASLAG